MESMKMTKSKAVWLKSAVPMSFMRSAKNKFDYPYLPGLPSPHSHSFSLFILHWICHSALKYSCLALKNKCICRKEQKLKREKLVILQDTLLWWKWKRALSQAVASGNVDDVKVFCGSSVWVYAYVCVCMCTCVTFACDDVRKSR